jgi:type IV pilus assembly protein PilW
MSVTPPHEDIAALLYSPNTWFGNSHRSNGGYTLVELMVAMTIGLAILAALVTIFANNSRARAEIDRANQQTENGRYAMQLISDDLHNAGYLAAFNPIPLTSPAVKPDACATDVPTLNSAMPLAIQGYDNGANAPTCLNDLRPGTDILVVRRASTCAVGDAGCDAYAAGAPYIQASGCSNTAELASGNVATFYALDTNTANLTLHQKDCTTPAAWHQYRTHIYFVANNDTAGDGIPTLKRAELGVGGFTIVPLVEGIENLQFEYGLDTSVPTTGAPAVFTADPDSYNGCAASICVGYWRNAVAAKISLLARNTTTTPGYVDTKIYALGLNADGTVNTVGPTSDGYKRHAYESVVRLNNTSGRYTP